jgi:hypothetical protein
MTTYGCPHPATAGDLSEISLSVNLDRISDSMGAGGLRPPSRHQPRYVTSVRGERGGNPSPRVAPPGASGLG